MGIIGLLFVIAVIRMYVTYKTDREYAQRGEVPPRYQVKLAQYEAGKRDTAPARLGAGGYLRELWHDVWDDLHGHRQRIREERKAGERPSRRERAGVWWRLLTTPVGESRRADDAESVSEPDAGSTPASAQSPVEPLPAGTKTVGPDGEWKPMTEPASAAEPVSDQESEPPSGDTSPPVIPEPLTVTAEQEIKTAPTEVTTMTAPTGEVVNHETHVAELDAQIKVAQEQVDSATAFADSIEAAETALDSMQQTYQSAAAAAQSKLDHETALNLDSTTLGHAGTAVDAMPPNAVNTMYEHFELMKQQAKERKEQAEAALAALEAERAHVISEYGEEFAKVANNLGGDARYLDSGSGTTTSQPSSSEAFPFEAPGTRHGDEAIPAQTIAALYPEDMVQAARSSANR